MTSSKPSGPPPSSSTPNTELSPKGPLWDRVRDEIEAAGFEHYGCARLERPFSIDIYRDWLKKDFAGSMGYLERHLEEKENPTRLLKRAQSAIVITKNYVPHPEPAPRWPLKAARIARYAQGLDYHHWLKARLETLAERLRALYPEEEFLTFTDSAPVLERDLASRAGLGWVGKNTCLLDNKNGSLFLIGEIYTSLSLPVATLRTDHCGTCTRCLEACPTGALTAPRELDARKCISYLTIESREVPPENMRHLIGDWLFGCDICQTVCPWNLKVHGREAFSEAVGREDLIADLRFLLTASHNQLDRVFRGTALSRAGAKGLKRNALIVCGNTRLSELRSEVEALSEHPTLGPLATWTLQQFTSGGVLKTPPTT